MSINISKIKHPIKSGTFILIPNEGRYTKLAGHVGVIVAEDGLECYRMKFNGILTTIKSYNYGPYDHYVYIDSACIIIPESKLCKLIFK